MFRSADRGRMRSVRLGPGLQMTIQKSQKFLADYFQLPKGPHFRDLSSQLPEEPEPHVRPARGAPERAPTRPTELSRRQLALDLPLPIMQDGHCLVSRHGWERIQEIVQRKPVSQVFEQRRDRDAGAKEYRLSFKDIRVAGNPPVSGQMRMGRPLHPANMVQFPSVAKRLSHCFLTLPRGMKDRPEDSCEVGGSGKRPLGALLAIHNVLRYGGEGVRVQIHNSLFGRAAAKDKR